LTAPVVVQPAPAPSVTIEGKAPIKVKRK
jgi:hypothetical protein